MRVFRYLATARVFGVVLVSIAMLGLSAQASTPTPTPCDPSPAVAKRGGSPVSCLVVHKVRDGWQASLSLTSEPDELRVTLNGTQANGLFRTGILGSQTARLAPDDGLVHGRNVLTVVAVRDGVTYPRRPVIFYVAPWQILASAGPDGRSRAHAPISLDASASLGLSPRHRVNWRIIEAPQGSTATLSAPSTLSPIFTPDRNGVYLVELRVRDPATGRLGRDVTTVSARPNYPPIGVGIETIAPYDGGYAIVIGTNCAAEVAGCPPDEAPGQVQVYPYQSGYPVQLLILAREDLSLLWSSSYAGNGGDAVNVVTAIQNISSARTKAGYSKPIVILSALDGPWEISTDFQSLSLPTILSKTNFQQYNNTWFNMVTNNPGWSAVGIAIDANTAGPAGYLNPQFPAWPQGNLTGYLQFDPTAGIYNFVPGEYAAFNTAAGSSSASNTMEIDGTTFTSDDLGSCLGGFHLVVLEASTLEPEQNPNPVIPPNQTFLTNCGSDTNDCSADPNNGCAIDSLANTLNTAQERGVLLFLQSIGTPIASSTQMQKLAAVALSPAIDALGGVGDAFNKSISDPDSPSYALVGGGFLLSDAPIGTQQAFGLEASGAAGASQPAYLDGLLKRSQLWRFTPVAGGSWPTQAAVLPQIVYQAPVDWPYSTPEYQATMECISEAMAINGDYSAGCYQPANNNVRAAYCDPDIDWSELNSEAVESACGSKPSFTDVLDQLLVETGVQGQPGIGNLPQLHSTIVQYQTLYTSQQTDSGIGLKKQVQDVLNALTAAPDPLNSALPVAGFWGTLITDSLDVVSAGGELVEQEVPGLGLFAALGHLVSDFLVGDTGASQLGAIIDTTADEVATQLQNRYTNAANSLTSYQDIIRSDYGKLSASFALPQFNSTTEASIIRYMQKGVQRFAYGRMLGASYNAYGLLPTDQNTPWPDSMVDPILSPDGYICQGELSESTPFSSGMDSLGQSWVNFTYQNWLPPMGIYGPEVYPNDAPFLLVLGREEGDSYSLPSDDTMTPVFDPVDGTGLGAWPTWFFRRNFDQVGFADCVPVRDVD